MRTLKTFGQIAIVLALALSMAGAAVVSTAPSARADHNTISWSSPVTVASSVNFGYPDSWVVTDGHGYTYVFYQAVNTLASTANMNVTKYAAVGTNGLPHKLFEAQVNDVSNVVAWGLPFAAAIGPEGNLYAAWNRNPVAPGAPSTIYVSTSTNGGVTWQAAKLASSPTAGGQNQWPNIAVGPDGTVWVTWLQNWGGHDSVTISKSADHGLTFSGWTNVTTSASIGTASLAVDASGRVYVAYSNFVAGYFINATWSDDGVTWSAPQTLNNPNTYILFPALLADSSGFVHLAWYSSIPGGNWKIDYSRSADRGASWTGAIPITASFSGGYIGYLAGEGDTVMYVFGSYVATGFGFVISADHGTTWYPDEVQSTGQVSLTTVAADQNGTFWVAALNGAQAQTLWPWYGPPSKPVVDGVVASGADGLTITWTAPPEQNVVDYRIWRSTDGTNFQAVGFVGAGVTSFTDTGLANGTYYYVVTAINVYGTPSHDSAAASGTVGVTVGQLENEIANLQSQLNSANADLASIQTQLNSLKGQLTAVQGNTTALQNQINKLQDQINTLQGQQATQTMAYANLAFEIIVVVLLVVLLLNQMRKPKNPTLMMAQPGQAEPKKPDEEL